MLGIRAIFTKCCSVSDLSIQQTRNTFILKRRTPPPLYKKGGKAKKMSARHFIYDLVQDSNIVKQPDMKIILKQYVAGVGYAGDVLTLRPNEAYIKYLLPGLAVYATPENNLKYEVDKEKPKVDSLFSSPYVSRTMGILSSLVLSITMNKTEPWTLEPWHITASFRKSNFVVPEHAITMPPGIIKGPDLSLQDKEFFVTVTINKKEKVNVRCRIHHWATGLDRLPWKERHWEYELESLFPEQAEVLAQIPLYKKE